MKIVTPPVLGAAPTRSPEPRIAPVIEGSWSPNGVRVVGAEAPFLETEPNPRATRRMLLVFFYFAPSAEVGALRWISLARYGAERGWAVDVVTLHPDDMGTLDPARLSRLPRGVRLFGFSGEHPTWYRTLLSAWRRTGWGAVTRPSGSGMAGHLDGTDLGVAVAAADDPAWRRSFRSRTHFWLADALTRRAAQLGHALARANQYDLVVSSGPPHAAHDSARLIAARAGIPFVMDMRDPWSDETAMPEELRSGAWRRAASMRERRCVSSASLVVVTSRAHEELQVKKYPGLRGRVQTVMNGADEDPLPPPRASNRFLVAFAGMIYLGRNPRALFRAAARVVEKTGARPEEFGVEFMGDDACDGIPLTRLAGEEGLVAHFRSFPFRPRDEALEFLSGASMLVSLPLRTTMTLPAKLFEYMRFDAWILALAEPGSATAELLRDTGADVVRPDDADAIAEVIARRFAEFRAGVRPVAINRDGRFDRSTQAARFFDAVDGLVARKPTADVATPAGHR